MSICTRKKKSNIDKIKVSSLKYTDGKNKSSPGDQTPAQGPVSTLLTGVGLPTELGGQGEATTLSSILVWLPAPSTPHQQLHRDILLSSQALTWQHWEDSGSGCSGERDQIVPGIATCDHGWHLPSGAPF